MTKTTETAPTAATVRAPERIQYINPVTSIYEDADGFTVEAEMPGVAREGVSVAVHDGELVFTGSKAPRASGTRVYGESARADYRRVFDLDPAVEADKITARLDQGVLVLRLPKAQGRKPRHIVVTD